MKPKITVIIPIGEGRSLDALGTIKKQKEKVNVIIEKGPNPSINRNRGIKKAKTEIIAFINGHTILPDDWSKKARIFFENYKNIDIAGGPQFTPINAGFFEKVSGYALGSQFGSGEANVRYNGKKLMLNADEINLTSANLACRKKVFKKIKFDEKLYPGEDPKFISDAKRARFKVAYNPAMLVYNKRRANIKEFFIQNFNYGQTRPKKENLKETLKHPFFLIPSIFLLYLIFLIPLALINVLFLIPAIVYLSLSIIFSSYESFKNGNLPAFFVLPFIFLSIHLSYGAGFIYGYLKKCTIKKSQ